MSDEAKVFAITGFGGGVSVGIKADSYDEFVGLAKQVYGDTKGEQFALEIFNNLSQYAPTAQAAGNVQAVFPAATPVADPPFVPNNVVPMPTATAPVVAATPPTLVNPGPCNHGPRQYKSNLARGKQWNRWECALEWKRGDNAWNAQRCQPVNAETS